MAKISGSPSSSSSSTGSSSFHSSVGRESGTSRFQSLSQFSGKFSAVAMPHGQSGVRNGHVVVNTTTPTTDATATIVPRLMTQSLGLLQRTILQDRVMLSTTEASRVQVNAPMVATTLPVTASMEAVEPTPVGFWNKLGKWLFGLALLPVLPFIGLYKLGDWAMNSLHKHPASPATNEGTTAMASNSPMATMPPPSASPPPPPAAVAPSPLPQTPTPPTVPPKVAGNYGTVI